MPKARWTPTRHSSPPSSHSPSPSQLSGQLAAVLNRALIPLQSSLSAAASFVDGGVRRIVRSFLAFSSTKNDAVGAEISGLDLSQTLSSENNDAIQNAFLKHHLLCFRSDPLRPQEFADLSRHFGDPQIQLIRKSRHNEVPEISVLDSTYKKPGDKPADFRLSRKAGCLVGRPPPPTPCSLIQCIGTKRRARRLLHR